MFFPGWPVNMSQSVPSRTRLDVPCSISDLSTPEKDIFRRTEKMSILSLRTLRTPVFANSAVRLRFNQPSRHPGQGVLKLSARTANWLPNGIDKRLNFQNRPISNLFSTGVSVMAKLPPETRSSVVRYSRVGCLRNNIGSPSG